MTAVMSANRSDSASSTPDQAHADARRDMVDRQLRRRGIRDERVLAEMAALPRHLFLPPSDEDLAYADQAIQVGHGQTISQPYMVGLMTELLCVRPGDRVLEIGTGTGYQTALLAHLCREVFSVERLEALSTSAAGRLDRLGIGNVRLRVGDGSLGWPQEAPFDGIMVTAGAPSVPPALPEQLSDGGRLVVPVGNEATQALTVIERRGDRRIETPSIACRFVPLVGQGGWRPEDVPAKPDQKP